MEGFEVFTFTGFGRVEGFGVCGVAPGLEMVVGVMMIF